MFKKLLVFLCLSILLVILKTPKTFAQDNVSDQSAKLQAKELAKESKDSRIKILQSFLAQYDSPLTPFAQSFVENADKYDLDWRLVTAISGVESTFGLQIPSDSYNGWGWGIFGDNIIRFSSWDEGIETVSKGLRENYINKWKAEDVYQIGSLYAASKTWASRVVYFMDKIQNFALTNPKDSLSLSL